MKAIKVCLLGVSLDTGNLGVNALAVGAIQCIRQRWPDASVFVLDYGTAAHIYEVKVRDGVVQVPLVNMRFSKKFYLRNHIVRLIATALLLKLIPSRRLRAQFVAENPCLRQISECDFAGSIAGGDSFSDIYGLARLLYVGLPQLLVLLLGKKLILLPQTVGPFKSRFGRAFARFLLRRAATVYSRDLAGVQSAQRVIGTGAGHADVKFGYDMGFTVEPFPPVQGKIVGLSMERLEQSKVVGLNISGLLIMGGYNQNNMFGLKAGYDKLTYRLIDFFIAESNVPVLLVPHVFGDDPESDAATCRQIYENLKGKYGGKIGRTEGAFNQSEIKHLIGRCDFFVGARMHACIGAVSQSVPTVPVAYSDKFIGVMETLGIEELVVDLRSMTEEEIVSKIASAYSLRIAIRKDLERRVPEATRRALELFKDVNASGTRLHRTAISAVLQSVGCCSPNDKPPAC